MLPQRHRMRTSAEFSHAFRSGIRTGRRNIGVSTAKNPGKTTQVGFIVSSASASWDQLRRDYESALETAFAKLDLPQSKEKP